MSRQQRHSDSLVEVKSKFDAEYRRFALSRGRPGGFQDLLQLLQTLHHLQDQEVLLEYADLHGDLLPINNDGNFQRAVSAANPLLRIIITKKDDGPGLSSTLQRRKRGLGLSSLRSNSSASYQSKNKASLLISCPQDFRQVSSIIDVDILPETHRRVRFQKHGTKKPLGFYIRDGVSVRVTPQGVEKVPGIFISRLVPGGLAESTGLLALNDEVLEVNGINVAGKSLDQVTDMMVANSHNLIVTVIPANQRNNVVHRGNKMAVGPTLSDNSASHDVTTSVAEGDSDEEDEDVILESDALYHPHLRPLPQSVSMPTHMGASPRHESRNGSTALTASSSQDGNMLTL